MHFNDLPSQHREERTREVRVADEILRKMFVLAEVPGRGVMT